jgi:hypothetical protein
MNEVRVKLNLDEGFRARITAGKQQPPRGRRIDCEKAIAWK